MPDNIDDESNPARPAGTATGAEGVWLPLIDTVRLRPYPAGNFVPLHGAELAVFDLGPGNAAERYVVIDNACPHAHGNLSGGALTGQILTCPWHAWQFDMVSGMCVHNAAVRVRKYACEVRDGVLHVCI